MEARNNGNLLRVAKLSSNSLVYRNAIHLSSKHQVNQAECFAVIKLPDSELSIYYPVVFDPHMLEDEVQVSTILRHALQWQLDSRVSFDLIDNTKIVSSVAKRLEINLRSIKKINSTKNLQQQKQDKIKVSEMKMNFINKFNNYPLCIGQDIAMPFGDEIIVLSIDEVEGSDLAAVHFMNTKTLLNFVASPFSAIQFEMDIVANDVFIQQGLFAPQKQPNININLKGVGGHKKIIEEVFRQIFYSRLLPPELAALYNVKHAKGVIFFGPPGTGKTHLARSVATIFPHAKVKVVNGPELKSKYVGESPENVRQIFYEADQERADKGKASDLHVYIFDEIDAIAPVRGTGTGTHAEDDIVAQLLTKLDGVDEVDNVLIIGTTNRIELVDPALLRPGRLEVHKEIGLPDEEGRFEMLNVKTESMRQHDLLDNVDLKYWAKEAKNYSAAELELLVRNATNFAMENNIDIKDGNLELKKDIKSAQQLARVNTSHFFKSFQDIKPVFGMDKTCELYATNVVLYNKEITNIVDEFLSLLAKIEKNHQMSGFRMLISGESGVGKTSLAMYLAKMSGVNCIRTITPSKLISLPLQKQLDLIDEELANAKRVPFSIIVLDELEALISADADFSSYSNLLRLKFGTFLKSIMQLQNKCVIIATATNMEFLNRIKYLNLFDEHKPINKVNLEFETLNVICEFLGYKIVPSSKSTVAMTLAIRDLVYQIKKYCADEAAMNVLDIDDFYNQINNVGNVPKYSH